MWISGEGNSTLTDIKIKEKAILKCTCKRSMGWRRTKELDALENLGNISINWARDLPLAA